LRISILLTLTGRAVVLSLFTAILCFSQEIKVLENGRATALGSDIGYFPDTPTRMKIDLAGTWSYSLDEEQWTEVKVPGSFDYEGRITFLRKFSVSEEMLNGSAFKIVALGINYEAELYVNDIFVGKHSGGYTSFAFNIPEEVVQPGDENAVKIVVSNVLSAKSTLPLRKQIWAWRNYGGVLRDLYIVATPRLWVESLTLKPMVAEDQRRGTVGLSAIISNQQFSELLKPDSAKPKVLPTYQLSFEVVDILSGVVVTQTSPYVFIPENGKDSEVSLEFGVANIRFWSPDAPSLYRLKALVSYGDAKKRTTIDQFDTDFGFASITQNDGALFLNGKKIDLKGVVWVEDSPEHGASLTYDEMEKDVAQIKVMGANAIRFAFHPPHPYMINLCNRYGIFALEELPVWNVPGELLGAEVVLNLAEQTAREMVQRDRNNPCILGWGIGDDFDSSDPRARGYAQRITALIKSIDVRPVYFGSRMLANDQCVDVVDMAAANIPTNDLKEFKEQLASWKKAHPSQPVLVLRYGKMTESKNHNGYSDPMSEESQARFFLQYYGAIRDANVAGGFVQAFADWRGDRPILTARLDDQYVMPVGLLDARREKRLAYDVVKTLFAGQKVAALPIGKYRTSFPVVHIVAGFSIIFVIAYQYHYNRRFNESLKRSMLRSYNFFADLRDVRTVSVFHTLLLALMISLTLAVVLSSILYHFRTDTLADAVLTQVVVSDVVKEYLIRATWNPLEGIAAFTGMFFFLSVLLATLVRFISLFVKSKIHFMHAFTVVVWASAPFIVLSPFGMSLFKILQTPFYVIPSFVVLFVLAVWISLRILKGISVILDKSALKTYVVGSVVLGALIVAAVTYYDAEYSLTAYMQFLYHIMSGSA